MTVTNLLDRNTINFFLILETTEETLQTVETELKKQNFECWETSVGGNGVMCHDPACGTFSSIPDFLKTT